MPLKSDFVKHKFINSDILQDLKDMMSGSSKGLPIKVPTIPIKVITSNASQVSVKSVYSSGLHELRSPKLVLIQVTFSHNKWTKCQCVHDVQNE